MIFSSSAFPLRANDPDLFKRWKYGGIQELGEHAGDGASAELACTVQHQG